MSAHLRDPLLARLTSVVMRDGKRHSALRIIDEALWVLKRDMNVAEPVEFVRRAVDNAKPLVELRRHKAAGRVIQVPTPCRPRRQEGLALRFIRYVLGRASATATGWERARPFTDWGLLFLFLCRDAFRSRSENGSGLRLARELADLEAKTGKAYKKREELHKQAEANRAYSHFLR